MKRTWLILQCRQFFYDVHAVKSHWRKYMLSLNEIFLEMVQYMFHNIIIKSGFPHLIIHVINIYDYNNAFTTRSYL